MAIRVRRSAADLTLAEGSTAVSAALCLLALNTEAPQPRPYFFRHLLYFLFYFEGSVLHRVSLQQIPFARFRCL